MDTIEDKVFADLLKRVRDRRLGPKAVAALRELITDADTIANLSKRRGRAKGGGQSSKAKGRRGAQVVRDLLLARLALEPDDVLVKATSMGGTDLHLSPRAQQVFPYGIEVKCCEAINIWAALAQATVNAEKQHLPPIVFFTRAHAPLYVALPAEAFVRRRCCDNGFFGEPHGCQKQDAR